MSDQLTIGGLAGPTPFGRAHVRGQVLQRQICRGLSGKIRRRGNSAVASQVAPVRGDGRALARAPAARCSGRARVSPDRSSLLRIRRLRRRQVRRQGHRLLGGRPTRAFGRFRRCAGRCGFGGRFRCRTGRRGFRRGAFRFCPLGRRFSRRSRLGLGLWRGFCFRRGRGFGLWLRRCLCDRCGRGLCGGRGRWLGHRKGGHPGRWTRRSPAGRGFLGRTGPDRRTGRKRAFRQERVHDGGELVGLPAQFELHQRHIRPILERIGESVSGVGKQ